MTNDPRPPEHHLEFGSRVRVDAAAGSGAGLVAEDVDELPNSKVRLDGATTIRPRRYAVALGSGHLLRPRSVHHRHR